MRNDIYHSIGNDVTGNGTSCAPFATITKAISVAAAGNTIYVDAGTYAEDVIVNKPLTILGANKDKDACSGTRIAESVIVPATSSPFGEIIKVQASNVTIKGFTIDGDNVALTSGILGHKWS